MPILIGSLALCFGCFYIIGELVAGTVNKKRLVEIQETAQKIPVGISSLGERFVPATTSLRLRRRLIEAGQPRDLDVDAFISLKVVGLIAGAVLAIIVGLFGSFGVSKTMALIMIMGLTGFFGPDAWLARFAGARKQKIRSSLPDILDMLTISVEAGLSFDGAVAKVVKNFKGALSSEFRRWLQETQLGRSRKEAWRDLAGRINVPDVNSFVLAILQADAFGVSIGKVLRIQAEEMRVKRRQRAEEIAMKAPVKVVFPLVLCIFPALMIVILGPAGIRIVQSLRF